MKISTNGPLADSIELYLAHKRSLGKELAKVEPMLLRKRATNPSCASRSSNWENGIGARRGLGAG